MRDQDMSVLDLKEDRIRALDALADELTEQIDSLTARRAEYQRERSLLASHVHQLRSESA